jgi:hypothetical protein
MREDDRREQIARLEVEIDELVETIERCRKIRLVGRAAVGLGAMLFLAVIFTAIRFGAAALMAAIALVLGGIVVLGSNRSTSQQAAIALKTAEANRAELIGQLDLTLAGDNRSDLPDVGRQ